MTQTTKDIFTLNGDGTIAAFLNTTSNAGDHVLILISRGEFLFAARCSTTLHPTRIVASAREQHNG